MPGSMLEAQIVRSARDGETRLIPRRLVFGDWSLRHARQSRCNEFRVAGIEVSNSLRVLLLPDTTVTLKMASSSAPKVIWSPHSLFDESEINMKNKNAGLLMIIGLGAFLFGPSPAFAQITLGTAQNFAVLGGQTVTNTGGTVINTGDVGVSPGAAIVGFPPGLILGGVKHAADLPAAQAQFDLGNAYDSVAGAPCTQDLTGLDLGPVGGRTLVPGVYCFTGGAILTGTLNLDFQGNPNAFFLFKTVSDLVTGVGSSVIPINTGGTTCPPNVYWKIGSSATLEVGSRFVGNILALTSISVKTGAVLNGRALARNGQVSLDTNNVTACATAPAIVCPLITLSPATVPAGTIGAPYSVQFTATGLTAPFTFSLASGTLPTGLTLSSAGLLSGTPTALGPFNFTIKVNDFNCSGSTAFVFAAAPGAGAVGGDTLDFVGMTILMVLLAGAGLFVMNRFSS